jgi:nucleoside-diphosphate-sugar epimerase
MNILLTGATGFLGSKLATDLQSKSSVTMTLTVRRLTKISAGNTRIVDGLSADTDWSAALANQDIVIHAAARAHILKDEELDPLTEYRKVNVDGTLTLARQASLAGVKRFIFVSSIKVNGEGTLLGRPFQPEDSPSPKDSYGISKCEAEAGLLKLAAESGMEVVIIRPPLIYGPGVKANFASMVSWVRKGIPLPFGMVGNKRSLVAIDNLVDFILLCADRSISPKAANQVFLVSDGEDVSTTTLLRKVARAYGVQAHLLPVPVLFLRLVAKLLGKSDVADRLFGNLQVDSRKALELLGWKPIVTMDDQLWKMAEHDLGANKK